MGTEYAYHLVVGVEAAALRDDSGQAVESPNRWSNDPPLVEAAMRILHEWDLTTLQARDSGQGEPRLWIGRVLWRSDFSSPATPQMSRGFALAELDEAVAQVKAALARYGPVPVRVLVLESAT